MNSVNLLIFFRKKKNMSGKSIQLPFGVVRDKSKEKLIKLNLPPNYRKDVLFDQLPFLDHLENASIKDVIKDGIVDNLSLWKHLLATGLLKDSIQDSLDMIVTDGKFNNASVRRALETKYPSVMKKWNPIDIVFKDEAKFHTQNPIIGTLLTQIQSEKTKCDKAIENQLKGAPSIKDLGIAEQLERFKQYNKRNNNDKDDDDTPPPPAPPSASVFDPLPHYLSLSSFDSDGDIDIEGENPIQKFLLGDKPQKEKLKVTVEEKDGVTAGEKTAIKKVRFLDNLSKLFPEADEIFDNEKIVDDLPEITIPNTQTMFKELNDEKISEELKFFSGENDGSNELKLHAMLNIGMLNESNEHFLDYLSLDFAHKVSSKNKMKIYLDTGNIYYNNLNMRESIYSFMGAQQDETKKFIDFDLDINDNFEFYFNEVIVVVTDDKFDIDTHSTSKFLFYHFNNLRHDLGEELYKVKTYYYFRQSTRSGESTEWRLTIFH